VLVLCLIAGCDACEECMICQDCDACTPCYECDRCDVCADKAAAEAAAASVGDSSAPLGALMGMMVLAGVGVAAVAVTRRGRYAPVPSSDADDSRAGLLESGAAAVGGSYGAVTTNTKVSTREGSYSSLADSTAKAALASTIESL